MWEMFNLHMVTGVDDPVISLFCYIDTETVKHSCHEVLKIIVAIHTSQCVQMFLNLLWAIGVEFQQAVATCFQLPIKFHSQSSGTFNQVVQRRFFIAGTVKNIQ